MHDRRIDGDIYEFGNQGALYMNAMTWFDHETETIWSQPWGRGIEGLLKGVELFPLPFTLAAWSDWVEQHPDTQLMVNDLGQMSLRGPRRFDDQFVIGLLLADQARAYEFTYVEALGVVEDELANVQIALFAANDSYYAYVRQVADTILTFSQVDGGWVDDQTGSEWDITRGLAIAGSLQGQGLQQVPSLSSFDWAWEDFYPNSEIVGP